MTSDNPSPLVPKLRFPEFIDEPPWEYTPLKKLAKRITKRNTRSADLMALTNSAEHGVVDQREYFDRDIARNTENYFVMETGDYVYNSRSSSTAPVGPISKNQIGPGVISPIYTVFRFQSDANDFFAHYFRSSHWHGYLRRVSNSGARHDRLAITKNDLMQMPIPTPTPHEQQTIADCLGSLEDLIAAEDRKLETLRQHKQGLMQQLFPQPGETVPRLRFPEFHNEPEWEEKELGDVSEVLMCKRIFASQTNPNGGVPFFKIGTLGREPDAFISKDLFEEYKSKYNFPRPGEILITCSGTVGKCLAYDGSEAYFQDSNIVWIDNPTLEVSNEFLLRILSNVNWSTLNSTTITRIYGPDLRGVSITFPQNEQEQQRIAHCLSALSTQIGAQMGKLDILRTHKQGLLQQLFPSLEGH